jgi:polysaccharide pyruvyl transferase WcaK-like protein
MRVAHFGTFDVANYGDLLFPRVIEKHLAPLGADVIHVSPVGGEPVWQDCVPTLSFEEAMSSTFDAIVVGGGHLIHARPASVAAYQVDAETARLAYAGLWLGAGELAGRLEVPLVWNAPGVPGPFLGNVGPLACWAAASVDRLAVRDRRSLLRLRDSGFAGPATVALDTAVEVEALFSQAEREAAYVNAFTSRGHSVPSRSIAIHVNGRYTEEGLPAIAEIISRLCDEEDAVPVFLAMGPCHGDDEVARMLGDIVPGRNLVIDRPAGLLEIASCIAESAAYWGTSLHGLVTACAHGRPGLCIARESKSGAAKFTGFIEQWAAGTSSSTSDGTSEEHHAPVARVDSWTDAAERWREVRAAAPREEPSFGLEAPLRVGDVAPGSVAERSSRHWDWVIEGISMPRQECKARRGGTLRALDWLLPPDWKRGRALGALR